VHGHALHPVALVDEHRADVELDQHRGVTLQDADVALDASRDDHGRLAGPHLPLGGDQMDLERHRYAPASEPASDRACASASSIPPTKKKACSGRWSYSPSASPLNEEMVSSTGVYLPSIPVNCSATKNGCDRNRWMRRARFTMILSSSDSSSMPRIAMMSCRSL